MITPEQKDELRLWHARLRTPEFMRGDLNEEFRKVALRYRHLFVLDNPPTDEQIEVKEFIRQLNEEADNEG